MESKINLISLINEINEDLSKCTGESEYKEENNVSELHIHKILFILYGAFYNKFKKEIFTPNFQAWKYGPVEIDYRNYVKNGYNEDSLIKFDAIINDKEEKFLKNIIIKLLKFSPWSLVEYTHSIDAWINNYDEKREFNTNKISNKEIQESFKNKHFD